MRFMKPQVQRNLLHQKVEMGQPKKEVVIVMVPFAAQGHMNQFLHLCRLLSPYHLPIHFVSTSAYASKSMSRLHGWDPLSSLNFHFHRFQPPSSVTPPTPPTGSTPLFGPSVDAAEFLREPISQLLRALSPTAHRLVVIHDFFMSSAVEAAATIRNADAVTFTPVSAFTALADVWEMFGKPASVVVDDGTLDDLPQVEGAFNPQMLAFYEKQKPHLQSMTCCIYDACRVLEGKYIDLMQSRDLFHGLKQWALGPFNPVVATTAHANPPKQRHKCLTWLDKQAPNSVVYVCFGTSISLSGEQVEELAAGLEQSGQKFLWVLRAADSEIMYQVEEGKIESAVGYEERVELGGQGMVVSEWAPQLEILEHAATGGFMSHCGWNSLMESLTMGVPVAAWPMHSDQPRNAVLVTKGLKTGIMVREWSCTVGNDLVSSSTIEKSVRRLMASEQGEEIRKRAADLGGEVRRSVAKEGVTQLELESFVAHITRPITV